MLKLFIAAALVLGVLATPAPARANERRTVGASVAAPGSQVTFAVKTFDPGSSVRFTLLDRAPVELGEAIADSQGLARATLRVPRNLPNGHYTVRASGLGGKEARVVDIQLTVRQVARPPFAVTQSQYRHFLALVAALLAFVLFAIQVRRRRRFSQAGYRA
jgi:hypothetical protein